MLYYNVYDCNKNINNSALYDSKYNNSMLFALGVYMVRIYISMIIMVMDVNMLSTLELLSLCQQLPFDISELHIII